MKCFSVDMDGYFFGESLPTLPSFSPSDEGRLIYVVDDDEYYFATNIAWTKASGAGPTIVDAHFDDTAAHSSTSSATPSRIVLRDSNGRAQLATPSASDDIAIKQTVDDEVTSRTNGDGTLQANLNSEISSRSTADSTHANLLGTSAHGMTTTNTASRGVVRDGSGDISARLLRGEYTSTSVSIDYFMGQQAVGTSDNYIRPMTIGSARQRITGTSSLSYNRSYNGYIKTIGGLLIQWGSVSIASGSWVYVTLPLTFNYIYHVHGNRVDTSVGTNGSVASNFYSGAGLGKILLYQATGSTQWVNWIALGK